MEYLDILDEEGNKTGEIKPRKEVHSNGYWHKGVHIWIINSKKNYWYKGEVKIKMYTPISYIYL